jgi:hypothetical protein
MKYWQIIADNRKNRSWSLGWVSAVDSQGRTIFITNSDNALSAPRLGAGSSAPDSNIGSSAHYCNKGTNGPGSNMDNNVLGNNKPKLALGRKQATPSATANTSGRRFS